MLRHVRKFGGRIKKVFYCTHASSHNCDCRKPKIGSIKEALQSVNKTIRHAKKFFFIGDTRIDIEAGKNAGCQTILVLSGRDTRRDVKGWKKKPDYIAKNLLEATGIVTHEDSHCSCHGRGGA